MSNASVTYTGDGSTKLYTVPYPYIYKSHVNVFVNGVAQTGGAWSWSGTTKVNFLTAPNNGDTVVIQRITPAAPLVNFADGSTLTAADLNLMFLQGVYLGQEAADAASIAMSTRLSDGQWNAQGLKVTNSADPTASAHLATKRYVDATLAAGRTNVNAYAWGRFKCGQASRTASAIANVPGTAKFTITDNGHGNSVGDCVTFGQSGSTGITGLDGSWTVTRVIDANNFQITTSFVNGASVGGGGKTYQPIQMFDSYNVDHVLKNANGDYSVYFQTSMISQAYVVILTPNNIVTTNVRISSVTSVFANFFRIFNINGSGTAAEPDSLSFVVFTNG